MNTNRNSLQQHPGAGLRIVNVKPVGKKKVYDITVADAEHYILENGVVTHNTGIYYSASTIFIIGRQQDKDGKDLVGFNFIINIEKSRYTKEKSKIPVNVSMLNGISRWSGLLDMALESGHVIKPKNGYYQRIDPETGELDETMFKEDSTNTQEFWAPIITNEGFNKWIENRYKIANSQLISDDAIDAELDAELEEV